MIDLQYSSLKFPPSEPVKRIIESAARAVANYPDPTYEKLRRILAKDASVSMEEVVVGNGLDDVIDQLSRVLNRPSFIPTPAFSEFARACKRNQKKFTLVPCLKNGSMDLSPLLKQRGLNGAVVWLANPNNPTGTVYVEEEIEKIIKAGAIVVLDEAYFEFLPNPNTDRWKNEPNVIRLRTFSKALGLPGARLGYAISSNRDILNKFESQRPFFPVNCMGLAAAECLTILRTDIADRIATVNAIRDRFIEKVVGAGYAAIPSVANFVLVDFGTREMTEKVLNEMKKAGILLLPPWDEEFADLPDRYIRFVIGTQDEMKSVTDVLEKMSN